MHHLRGHARWLLLNSRAVATGPATVQLHFESPISDGNIIVYVNGERAVQKTFDFSRKAGLFKRVDGTGTVEASFTTQPGPAEVKVWVPVLWCPKPM